MNQTQSVEVSSVYDYAFNLGMTGFSRGVGVGSNPYDPEAEPEAHEAWLDGWSHAQTVSAVGC